MRTVAHDRRVYATGKRESTAMVVPVRDNRIRVVASNRGGWSDTGGEVVRVVLWLSLDGGRTWFVWGRFGAQGGEVRRVDGTVCAESWFRWLIPKQRVARLVKVEFESKVSLDTEIAIETDDLGREPDASDPHGSVTFDSGGLGSGSSVSSFSTASFTVGPNSNKALFAGCSFAGSGAGTLTSVKWNTTETFDSPATASETSSANLNSYVTRLLNPTATTSTVDVVLSASTANVHCYCWSLYDVDQTTPNDTATTGTDTSSPHDITHTGAANGKVIAICTLVRGGGLTITADAGQTSRGEVEAGNSAFDASEEDGAGSKTLTWTSSAAPMIASQIALTVNVAAAAGGSLPPPSNRRRLRSRMAA